MVNRNVATVILSWVSQVYNCLFWPDSAVDLLRQRQGRGWHRELIDGVEAIADQTFQRHGHSRESQCDDNQADADGDREADTEQVELGGGAAEDAECKVGNEQCRNHGERQLQPCTENVFAPGDDPDEVDSGFRAQRDRDGHEAFGDGHDQDQMAVHAQEEQHGEYHEQLCNCRGLPA